MGADTPEIKIGTIEGGLYVGLRGRATQRTCPTADKVVSDYLASEPGTCRITLDLSNCDWVDSTFAGWLISLSKRAARRAAGEVRLTGCNARCRSSLDKMKLSSLFAFRETSVPAKTQTIRCTTGDRPRKEEIKLFLEAHEALAAIDSENARIFMPIIAALREQIEKR